MRELENELLARSAHAAEAAYDLLDAHGVRALGVAGAVEGMSADERDRLTEYLLEVSAIDERFAGQADHGR